MKTFLNLVKLNIFYIDFYTVYHCTVIYIFNGKGTKYRTLL